MWDTLIIVIALNCNGDQGKANTIHDKDTLTPPPLLPSKEFGNQGQQQQKIK